jgi:hypothetical protein
VLYLLVVLEIEFPGRRGHVAGAPQASGRPAARETLSGRPKVLAGEEAADAGHGSRVPDPAVHLRAARGHVLQAVGHLG